MLKYKIIRLLLNVSLIENVFIHELSSLTEFLNLCFFSAPAMEQMPRSDGLI